MELAKADQEREKYQNQHGKRRKGEDVNSQDTLVLGGSGTPKYFAGPTGHVEKDVVRTAAKTKVKKPFGNDGEVKGTTGHEKNDIMSGTDVSETVIEKTDNEDQDNEVEFENQTLVPKALTFEEVAPAESAQQPPPIGSAQPRLADVLLPQTPQNIGKAPSQSSIGVHDMLNRAGTTSDVESGVGNGSKTDPPPAEAKPTAVPCPRTTATPAVPTAPVPVGDALAPPPQPSAPPPPTVEDQEVLDNQWEVAKPVKGRTEAQKKVHAKKMCFYRSLSSSVLSIPLCCILGGACVIYQKYIK